ncbi:MAG TPA: stage II sporulation protein E [Firmicutes bacterium]|nr:stage II sporulation protein E [Bacillota bacterium]
MVGQAIAGSENNTLSSSHPPRAQERILIIKKRRSARMFFRSCFHILLGILLSRFLLPGDIYPGGIALGLACNGRSIKMWEKVLLVVGIFVGTYSVKGFALSIEKSAFILLMFVISQIWHWRKKRSPKMIWVFTIWVILRFFEVVLLGITSRFILVTSIEMVCTYFLAIVFQLSLKFFDDPMKAFSGFTLPAAAIMIIVALGGTRNLIFQSFDFTKVLAILLLMVSSYVGGGGIGAAMGISIGTVLGMNTQDLIGLIAIYSVAGLLGGVFKKFRKWGTLLGTVAGFCLIISQLHGRPLVFSNLPWGVGMLSFVLIPRRYFTQIANFFPNSESASTSNASEEHKQLREMLNHRLSNLAGIFEELAKSFNDITQETPANSKMDLYTLLDQVCAKNCQHCNGYQVCWGDNFYSTYREIFDLIAYAELYGQVSSKLLKGRLGQNCFQQFRLLATINQLFEKCQNDQLWQRKLEESKTFVANQLQGISGIVNDLAHEITSDTNLKVEVEEKIYQGFHRMGIMVKEVSVLTCNNQGLEILIKQHHCGQKWECQYLASAMVGRLLDKEYTVWEKNCFLAEDTCMYCLTPARNFELKTTICKLSKDGNELSGDNQGLHELKDGHFVAILSDGMGHGSKAYSESKTTVDILEKLLGSGIGSDFAVKMVNSILLLRSPDESFATVDLSIIDLYTAQAEFIKIGAAATYVKREREVWSIQSTSLPAGILSSIDLERTTVQLQADDFVIMVTDGITDSKANQQGKEDWIIRALRQVEVVGPEALGEYLLNLAKINQGGIPMDDMTVIVLQIIDGTFPL